MVLRAFKIVLSHVVLFFNTGGTFSYILRNFIKRIVGFTPGDLTCRLLLLIARSYKDGLYINIVI